MTTDQTAELASSYDPTEAETKWYPIWEKEGYFAPAEDTGQETYTIVIPPPMLRVPCIWGMHSP